MILLGLVVVSGCGVPTVSRWTVPDPFAASNTTTTSPTTTTPTLATPGIAPAPLPAGPVPVLCGGGTLADRPAAALLNPLLMTVSDITPHGYISSGPDGATSSLLFGGELPLSVPVAAITYDQETQAHAGLLDDEIDEAVAQDTSAPAASDLAGQLQRAGAGCGPGSGTVPLAGTVPALSASVLLRREVPTTIAFNTIADVSKATVYAAKGRYVVEVTWENTFDPDVPGPGTQPTLPSGAVMGAVVDAALAHIPG
jgi:hypothetical protein